MHSPGTIQKKVDLVSSQWIPAKDRIMEIYWNRQKGSLWQEAMGNTQTGRHALRNCGNRPIWLVGICLCLLFAFVPDFHFSWVYHVKDVLLKGFEVVPDTRTEGLFILGLQSAETPGEGGAGERDVLSSFMPSSLFSPWLQIIAFKTFAEWIDTLNYLLISHLYEIAVMLEALWIAWMVSWMCYG